MLTPKVEQPATLWASASGPTASRTRMGCSSAPSRLLCERAVLVKVVIGQMKNVGLDVLYIVPIQGYQYPMIETTRYPVLR